MSIVLLLSTSIEDYSRESTLNFCLLVKRSLVAFELFSCVSRMLARKVHKIGVHRNWRSLCSSKQCIRIHRKCFVTHSFLDSDFSNKSNEKREKKLFSISKKAIDVCVRAPKLSFQDNSFHFRFNFFFVSWRNPSKNHTKFAMWIRDLMTKISSIVTRALSSDCNLSKTKEKRDEILVLLA